MDSGIFCVFVIVLLSGGVHGRACRLVGFPRRSYIEFDTESNFYHSTNKPRLPKMKYIGQRECGMERRIAID